MSTLSTTSIQRPVLTWVMSIVIVLFGLIGFTYLGVREYPSVDPPVITVSTNYTGANADVIESQITEPLEEAVSTIAGIRSLTSVSREGRSTITVEFNLEIAIETAANDVRDKVNGAVGNLPPDTDPPIVAKADANANPIIAFNVRSAERDMLSITQIARNNIKERLQTINGVSEIFIWGAKEYSMRLWMDPVKLSAYQLTPLDVRSALQRQNVELPSGRIEGNKTELSIRTMSKLTTPEEFNNLIIKQDGENIVRFSDIGKAELGPDNLRTMLRREGIPSVGLAIVPQPGANQVEIVDQVNKRLAQIQKDLPKDIEIAMVFDTTAFIRASISEVEETIFVALALVIAIIFLFLRDWRTTVIPVLAIPVSLIGAFFIMYVAGFSINVLTLLGIVLAIGLVVDDAIVLMENIYTKIENGEEPMKAAYEGSAEIYFAVIATTITLVAVFFPIVFLQGLTGRLFREFGITISGAILISAFVALTLTPMLSSRVLKHREKHNWFYNFTEPFFVGMTNFYASSLRWFMSYRWLALVIMAGAVWIIYILGSSLPSELAPMEDRSSLRLVSRAPEGATFEYMDEYVQEVVEYLQKNLPERETMISMTSPGFGASSAVNNAFVRIRLKDPDKRETSQKDIAARLTKGIQQFTDAKTFISQDPTINTGTRGAANFPVEYVIQAPNFEKLKAALPKFMEECYKDKTFNFVDLNLKFDKPELQLSINREKATKLNVSILDIAQTLQFSLSGQRFGYFIMDGKQYQVIGQLDRNDRSKPMDLKEIYVRANNGEMLQLDNLVDVKEESTPPQLYRYNRYISATVSAGLSEGKSISDGIKAMDAIAEKSLDESFSTALSGQSKDFVESSSSLLFAFVLALVLIYLVLAAQFESFIDPFVIMLTVPLAIAGAILSLWFYKQTLNVFSQIGIIMLIGLVTKNGILIVEFANQRKAEGKSILDAILEASQARFRPILMTSLSTILGTLPIALALGAGAQSRVPMGIAIVGGLIFSTVLTLYVIPAMYTFISGKTKKPAEAEAEAKEYA
jgi:multidrug efflux pump